MPTALDLASFEGRNVEVAESRGLPSVQALGTYTELLVSSVSVRLAILRPIVSCALVIYAWSSYRSSRHPHMLRSHSGHR
jgi:hypothetical protein